MAVHMWKTSWNSLALATSLMLVLHRHITSYCAEVPINVLEGEDVSLDFNFTVTDFSLLQLRKNGELLYQSRGESVKNYRRKHIEVSKRADNTTITLEDVDQADSGTFQCWLTGTRKDPVYNVSVISSSKTYTIEGIDGTFYDNNSLVNVVEGESLLLVCRVVGGLRETWSISWRIGDIAVPRDDHRVNLTAFDQYHEESSLKLLHQDVIHDDGAKVTCEDRDGEISVYLNVNIKPKLKPTGTLIEGIPSHLTCILNETVSHTPTFLWSLDGYDVSSNSSQRQISGIWHSTLDFYPIRSYFSKEIECMIDNDEKRVDSVVVEMNYPATILNLTVSPSPYTELGVSVNLSCQASGYPVPTLYWSKQSHKLGDGNWSRVRGEVTGHIPDKTTSETSLVIYDIQREDIGRYRCTASNDLSNSDEREMELYLEEYGILDSSPTFLFENIPVNYTCLIKRRNAVMHIPWYIGGLDVTRNATQDEFTSSTGEAILRSILLFYPKREFNEMYLTCNGGREPTSPYSVYLNISYCDENPVYHCGTRANDSNAGITCTTNHGITRNQIEFYQNNIQLDKVTVSSVNEGQGEGISKDFYYKLPPGNERLADTYNCCTWSQRCPRYCISCIVQQDYAILDPEEEFDFLPYILVGIAVLSVTIIILCLMLILKRQRNNEASFKQMDSTDVHAPRAVDTGKSIQATLGSLPAIYEHMNAGYTTRVHSPEDYTGHDAFDANNDTMDNISVTTEFTEVTRMSHLSTKALTLNEKMSKLCKLHAGVETQEKGNRLSRHFKDEEDSPLWGGDSPTLQTYSLKRVQSVEETFILDLTIHNKISQRGSFFFCDATLNYRHGSLPATVKVLSEYASNKERSHFLQEIGIVKSLGPHPNIVEILGTICISQPNCVIFVKMAATSLKQYLMKTRKSLYEVHVETEELRQYAEEICSGMLFLSNNGFCHPSLTCESVYREETGACKLYDFTPTDLCDINEGDGQIINELVAPELARGEPRTPLTDVWAFGNILWEICHYGLGSPSEDNASIGYVRVIAPYAKPKPMSYPDGFFRLMQLCWHEDPSSRPMFAAILTEIQDMRKERKLSTTV